MAFFGRFEHEFGIPALQSATGMVRCTCVWNGGLWKRLILISIDALKTR